MNSLIPGQNLNEVGLGSATLLSGLFSGPAFCVRWQQREGIEGGKPGLTYREPSNTIGTGLSGGRFSKRKHLLWVELYRRVFARGAVSTNSSPSSNR